MNQYKRYSIQLWDSFNHGEEVLCYVNRYWGYDIEFEPRFFDNVEERYGIVLRLAMAFRGITLGMWPRYNGSVFKMYAQDDIEVVTAKDMLRKFIRDSAGEAFIALDHYFWEGSSNPRLIDTACIEIVHMIANGYIDNAYLDESRIENLLRIVNTNGMPHEAAILLNLGKGERNVSEFSL